MVSATLLTCWISLKAQIVKKASRFKVFFSFVFLSWIITSFIRFVKSWLLMLFLKKQQKNTFFCCFLYKKCFISQILIVFTFTNFFRFFFEKSGSFFQILFAKRKKISRKYFNFITSFTHCKFQKRENLSIFYIFFRFFSKKMRLFLRIFRQNEKK